jgi:hypothetical protein
MATKLRAEARPLYERDYYAWTQEQAAALREGRLGDLDVPHLIEEVEDLGRSERRELDSRLEVLLLHLLKWRFQPERRANGWLATIKVQHLGGAKVLRENPSLRPELGDRTAEAYLIARVRAAGETDLPEDTFPETCPFADGQMLDADWLPA